MKKTPKPASVAVKAKPKLKDTSKETGAELVGRLASITASLLVLAVDASEAGAWEGVARDEGSEIQKIIGAKGFQRAGAAAVKVGAGNGWILDVQGQTGYCGVFRAGHRIVLIEPDDAYWEENREDDDGMPRNVRAVFRELAAAPTPAKAKAIGQVDVKSGVLLLGDVWTSYAEQARTLKSFVAKKAPAGGKGKSIGDDDDGLLVRVRPGRYAICRATHRLPWGKGKTDDLAAIYLSRQT